MDILKILLVFILSVIICKFLALLTILLLLFINKNKSEEILKEENIPKLTNYLKVIYLFSALIASFAAFEMLKFLGYKYALIIAVIMFISRTAISYIRYKNKYNEYLMSKMKEFSRNKA